MPSLVGHRGPVLRVLGWALRLWDTVCSFFIHEKHYLRAGYPGMHAFNSTAKNVALGCNSCAGWVGGAGNLISVPAVNSPRTKYLLRRQLFPVGRTSYRLLHCIRILRRQAQGGSKSFRRDDLPFLIWFS